MKMSGDLSVVFLPQMTGDNIKVCKTLFRKNRVVYFSLPAGHLFYLESEIF
jgi:hypothetical protein